MDEFNPLYIPGYWMGTHHGIDGSRIQCFTHLYKNGRYERSYEYPGGRKTNDKGTWKFYAGVLSYYANGDNENEEERWWTHTISGFESNCLLILRRAILASRNLPWLFYRMHLLNVVVFSGTPDEGKEVIALLEEKDISAYYGLLDGDKVEIVVEGEVDAKNAQGILKGREP